MFVENSRNKIKIFIPFCVRGYVNTIVTTPSKKGVLLVNFLRVIEKRILSVKLAVTIISPKAIIIQKMFGFADSTYNRILA